MILIITYLLTSIAAFMLKVKATKLRMDMITNGEVIEAFFVAIVPLFGPLVAAMDFWQIFREDKWLQRPNKWFDK